MELLNIISEGVAGNLVFKESIIGNGAQVHFGIDDSGLDVKFFGDTSGAYMLWDESADALLFAGGAYPKPAANDACALGASGYGWSDLFLASGAVLNFAAGDVTLTHSSKALALVGSETITATGLHATTGRALKVDGTVAAPAHEDGYGVVEVNANFSGTVAGPFAAAMSTWVNMAESSVPGANIITPHNDGIYLPSGITASSAKMVMGGRFHYVAQDGANPGSLFLFSTNIYDNALTAILDVNVIADLGGASGAASGNDYKIPFLKEATSGQVWYVNLYHS